mmetsp:Transcript_65714/g.136873  ORF Transcript_65714/g.136873 Transcript_65714/m.136873 type:complete len:275 (-) Transcript_65714:2168-2992(-)
MDSTCVDPMSMTQSIASSAGRGRLIGSNHDSAPAGASLAGSSCCTPRPRSLSSAARASIRLAISTGLSCCCSQYRSSGGTNPSKPVAPFRPWSSSESQAVMAAGAACSASITPRTKSCFRLQGAPFSARSMKYPSTPHAPSGYTYHCVALYNGGPLTTAFIKSKSPRGRYSLLKPVGICVSYRPCSSCAVTTVAATFIHAGTVGGLYFLSLGGRTARPSGPLPGQNTFTIAVRTSAHDRTPCSTRSRNGSKSPGCTQSSADSMNSRRLCGVNGI